MCTSCLPYFIALGPEKTGTTDLYNRIRCTSLAPLFSSPWGFLSSSP